MCLVFAKAGVELLLISIHGNNQFWQWQAWMLVLGLVGFALLQLWYLHKALKFADPTIVCPLAFCFYNLSSIVNGLIYFDQLSLLPASHLLLVTVGIFVLLGGVWAVSLQAVNIGTWSSENDVDVSLLEDGAADEGALPESSLPPAPPCPQTPEREHARAQSESAASPPHSPLSPRRRANRLHSLQVPYGGTMPVSSPPPPVPAPVFSIGLSPASPGFVLVPRERRRHVGGEDRWGDIIRRVRMRRDPRGNVLAGGEAAGQGPEDAEAGDNERISPARERWKWLQRLIVGRRA